MAPERPFVQAMISSSIQRHIHRSIRLLLPIACLAWTGCSWDDITGDSPLNRSLGSKQAAVPHVRSMRQVLDSIRVHARPMDNYQMNAARARMLRQLVEQTTDPRQQHQLYFELCRETLNSGATKDAIELIETMLQRSGGIERHIHRGDKPWFDLLAVAYLRMGEQRNCLAHHSPRSCFVPIVGDGIHVDQEPSRRAIELYRRILGAFPDDDAAKWLLNVAYMTVGEYPLGVPAQWRILLPEGPSGFPYYPEVAMDKGVAVNGLSGSVIIEDMNGDGWNDLFVTSYGLTDNARLFLNAGPEGFVDATETAGLQGVISGLNCLQADVDNDGHTDILVLRGGWLGKGGMHPNSLLRNNGDGTFTDVTITAGLLSFRPTQTAVWADFDLDGRLDLFIGNESKDGTIHPCQLYMARPDGTFHEVAAMAGVDLVGFVKGSTRIDANNDGRPDLYVSLLGGSNRLYINEGVNEQGIPRFSEMAQAAGVEGPHFSFPCWAWDMDNDGDEDLFVSGYQIDRLLQVAGDATREYRGLPPEAATVRLYRNDGGMRFTDVTKAMNMERAIYTMGCNFGDLDNDGLLDMYLATGAPEYSTIVPNRMFRNRGEDGFEEVTHAGGFGNIQKGHGAAFGDLDNDGDQDIYCVLGGAFEGDTYPNVLFENPGAGNAWVKVSLEGRQANRAGIGARIAVEVERTNGARRTIHRTVGSGGSFGANPLRLEVGLGDAKRILRLTIQWPDRDGTEQVLTDLPVRKELIIQQGAGHTIREVAPPALQRAITPASEDHHHHHGS